eukprot:gene59738-79685_t
MYGMYALQESVRQLRGTAAAQVPGARNSVCHGVGGMFGAFGTVLALKQRDRTGKGGLVESALFESVVFLMGQHLAITAINGAAPPPMPERVSSWAVYEIFNTADDLQVFIGITSDGQWKRFCEFFKQPELAADPKLATNNLRIEARPWLVPKVASVFKAYTKEALENMCLEADISFAPVARPQIAARPDRLRRDPQGTGHDALCRNPWAVQNLVDMRVSVLFCQLG